MTPSDRALEPSSRTARAACWCIRHRFSLLLTLGILLAAWHWLTGNSWPIVKNSNVVVGASG